MRLICLNGNDGTGKTTTLNLVYDTLVASGATIISPKKTLGNPVQNDFECVLDYLGKKIAFFTMGDYNSTLASKYKGDLASINHCVDKAIQSIITTGCCDVLIVAISSGEFPSLPSFFVNTTILQKRASAIAATHAALNMQDHNDIIALI